MPDQTLCTSAQSVITMTRSGALTNHADMGESYCRYGQTFEDMYSQMEARQKERQNQMRDQAAQGSTLDKVKQVWPELASDPILFCKPCKSICILQASWSARSFSQVHTIASFFHLLQAAPLTLCTADLSLPVISDGSATSSQVSARVRLIAGRCSDTGDRH